MSGVQQRGQLSSVLSTRVSSDDDEGQPGRTNNEIGSTSLPRPDRSAGSASQHGHLTASSRTARSEHRLSDLVQGPQMMSSLRTVRNGKPQGRRCS